MNSFIYIWFNTEKKKFYIGKHYGSIDDGYICSSKAMLRDYKNNPKNFKRRILEYINDKDGNQLLEAELNWLSLIKDEELGKKYYNLKNKNFGNTKGHKKSYVWNVGLNKIEQQEYQSMRKNKLFCLLTEKPKKGVIYKPVYKYNCKFCNSVFSSKKTRKFCSRKCSAKWGMENGNREKIIQKNKGRTAWNKGLKNDNSALNGKKSARKQSETVFGRRMIVDESGKRVWSYPYKKE